MMIRILSVLVLVASLGVGRASAAESLTLDSEKSKIEFIGKKPDGKHVGGFKAFKASGNADFQNHATNKLEIVIDTTSIWSDNEKLTNHLKNPDFFDVRKYPTITFTATKIAPKGEGKADITGDLTMLGKTVAITVPAKVGVDEERITINTNFKLDRTKWGMAYGTGNIENDVEVTAQMVFAR